MKRVESCFPSKGRYGKAVRLTVLILIAIACSENGIEEQSLIPVTIEVAKCKQIRRLVYASARLEGAEEAILEAIANSMIEEIHVSEGDTAGEGTLLITLKTDEVHRFSVQGVEALLIAAQVNREIAVNNFNRAVSLYEEGGISQQALNDATTLMEVAGAEAELAQAEYSRAVSEEENASITAPFDGSIVRIWAGAGEMANGPLLSISNSESVVAEVFLSENHIHLMKPGLIAYFQPTVLPDSAFEGAVHSATSTADPTSGLISARIEFPNPGGTLRTGMAGTVSIVLEERNCNPVVSESVLRRTDAGWEISVLRSGSASVRTIETGISNNGMYEILSGLQAGDSVIVLGHDIVTDGDRVMAVEEQ